MTNALLNESMVRASLDNVTIIVVAFQNLEEWLQKPAAKESTITMMTSLQSRNIVRK